MAMKTVTKEVRCCDVCGAEDVYTNTCMKCGVMHCWKCGDTRGVSYPHGVYTAGSGDGYYCNPCDAELLLSLGDPLHGAYVAIRDLKLEAESWSKRFRERAEAVEETLKQAQSDALPERG